MPAVMRGVFSSHVNRMGYDAETQELVVEWDSGKTSAYTGVPPEVANEAMTSWSVGSYLRSQIKPTYKHRYLE